MALIGVGVVSRYALLVVVVEALAASLLVIPAALAGLWLVPLFRLGRLPLRWHLLLGAALGLGATSLCVLGGGLAGVLYRPVWVILLLLAGVAGVVRLRELLAEVNDQRATPSEDSSSACGTWRYLWLLAGPFLGLALVAASNAPGLIWQEEGFGYDVLEYHLELPKEYFLSGRISYQPQNVYANFPANVEMWYLLAMIVGDNVVDQGVTANMIHLMWGALVVFAAWVAGREWSPRAAMVAGVVTATVGWLVYLSGLAYVEHGMLFFGMCATAVLVRSFARRERAGGGGDLASGRIGGAMALTGVLAGLACGCKYTAVALVAFPLAVGVALYPTGNLRRTANHVMRFLLGTLAAFSPWLVKNLMMTANPVFPLGNSVCKASPPGWGPAQTRRWDRSHTPLPDESGVSDRLRAFWHRVPGDPYQRFGPMLFVLALGGLVARRCGRIDAVLLVVLLIQLGVWLFATHLYARFAVVLLIPLVLLCGRSMVAGASVFRRGVIASAVVAGGIWNLVALVRLEKTEAVPGAPASLIYDGLLGGYEYFAAVNHDLPGDAKILLVGDARAFYFERRVDYCVVFNRNPFVDAIRNARDDGEILGWLREKGYTHVLVHWGEIRRLARSAYGFSPQISPALFNRLVAAGLVVLHDFPRPDDTHARYVTLYEVPISPSRSP